SGVLGMMKDIQGRPSHFWLMIMLVLFVSILGLFVLLVSRVSKVLETQSRFEWDLVPRLMASVKALNPIFEEPLPLPDWLRKRAFAADMVEDQLVKKARNILRAEAEFDKVRLETVR